MIKNVIFDIGNVLLDFCWKDHIARFGFQGEKADRIAQAMMLGPIWPKLDLGLESDEDILNSLWRIRRSWSRRSVWYSVI